MKNKKGYAEATVHILIWLFIYLVLIFFIKTIGPFKRMDGTLLLPVTLGTVINITLFYTMALILIPRLSEKKKAWEFIINTLVLLVLLTVTETIIDKQFFKYYYSDHQESLFSQLLLNFILNLIVLSFALGYGFIKNWLKNEKMKQSLRQEKLAAELDFLKTQLNPHFLFNVLNMAFSSASMSGDEKTADIIEKLSGLMRYMLYESNVEKIDLEKEIHYIKNYIKLQKMRFPEDMTVNVTFSITGDYSGIKIAPLILIQFIENAFKFGVKLDKKSDINISLNIINHDIEFSVNNTIFIKPDENNRKSSGIGIKNVKKRLAILYPDRHKLLIENSGRYYNVRLMMTLE